MIDLEQIIRDAVAAELDRRGMGAAGCGADCDVDGVVPHASPKHDDCTVPHDHGVDSRHPRREVAAMSERIELRAAEIASMPRTHTVAFDDAYLYPARLDGAELAGMIIWNYDSAKQPEQDGEWAGYLAAISSHEETDK